MCVCVGNQFNWVQGKEENGIKIENKWLVRKNCNNIMPSIVSNERRKKSWFKLFFFLFIFIFFFFVQLVSELMKVGKKTVQLIDKSTCLFVFIIIVHHTIVIIINRFLSLSSD